MNTHDRSDRQIIPVCKNLSLRVAPWNEEKLAENPLQRTSETALEDSLPKVFAIYFHCKTIKNEQIDYFCRLHLFMESRALFRSLGHVSVIV